MYAVACLVPHAVLVHALPPFPHVPKFRAISINPQPETPEMPETTPGGSGDDNTNTKPDGGVELQPDGSIGGGEETTPTVNPTE